MRALLVIVIVLLGGAIIAYATARLLGIRPGPKRWELAERVDADGTLRVGVARGSEFREVKAIPSGAYDVDVLSDVRIAKENAAELAAELNRRA